MDQALLLFLLLSELCWPMLLAHEYHFVAEPMSWSDAQTHCTRHYTDLASVSDMKDLQRLKTAANGLSDAWIGLQSSGKLSDREWHWSQPTVKYNEAETPWITGQPNDGNGFETQNCLMIDTNGLWNDIQCAVEFECFICYNESSNTAIKIHDPSNGRTWIEAQQFCRAKHTDLMSGQDQQKLLKEDSHRCLIGLFRDSWHWSDRSPSTFRNWKSYVNTDTQKCAALGDEGRWESAECGLKMSFICQGALKTKKTLVKINMSSPVDLNPLSQEILEQLQKQLDANNFGHVKLTWKKDKNQCVFKKQISSSSKKQPCA
ncbi:unnamed protein product [Knipowitschia caucasica]|uniref:C-type lectin domain-containing protein n=1 Tax=Knipowitschia caucasica TaxID=637954 RepID=A0AAV2JMT7_KNICA